MILATVGKTFTVFSPKIFDNTSFHPYWLTKDIIVYRFYSINYYNSKIVFGETGSFSINLLRYEMMNFVNKNLLFW